MKIVFVIAFLVEVVSAQSVDSGTEYPVKNQNIRKRYSSRASMIEPSGRWPWGPTYHVDVNADKIFVVNGSLFQIYQYQNGVQPQLIGEYLCKTIISDFIVEDSIAFLSASDVIAINISDPRNIKTESTFPIPGGVRDIRKTGHYLIGRKNNQYVFVLNVDNVAQPYYIMSAYDTQNPQTQITNIDSTLYIVNPFQRNTIHTYYIQNDSFFVGNVYNYGNLITFIKADAGKIYLQSKSVTGNKFGILQSVERKTLELKAEIPMPDSLGSIIDISGSRDKVILSTNNHLLSQLNLENLINPIFIKTYEHSFRTFNRIKYDSTSSLVFAAYDQGLSVLQISSDTSTMLQYEIETGGYSLGLDQKESLFVAAKMFGGISVFVIDSGNYNIIQKREISSFGADIEEVSLESDSLLYAYAQPRFNYDTLAGVWVYSLSKKNEPSLIRHIQIACLIKNTPLVFARHKNKIIVGKSNSVATDTVLQEIDVTASIPTPKPVLIGKQFISSISMDRNRIFISANDRGVYIYQFDSTGFAKYIETFPINSARNQIVDSVLYSVGPYLYSIKINAESDFSILDSLELSGGATPQIKISNETIYIYSGDLLVINATNPASLKKTASANIPFLAYGISVWKNKIALSANMMGIYFYKNSELLSVSKMADRTSLSLGLSQNYPNPFNPNTTITYDLPGDGMTTLKVYNVLGQTIAEIVNTKQESGHYMVTFNGSKLSSGMYIYKLTSGSFSQTKRMMLVK